MTTRSHWWINESHRSVRSLWTLRAQQDAPNSRIWWSKWEGFHSSSSKEKESADGINALVRFSFIWFFLPSWLCRRGNMVVFYTWPRVTPVAIRCSRRFCAGDYLLRNTCGTVKRSHSYRLKVFTSEGWYNKTRTHIYTKTGLQAFKGQPEKKDLKKKTIISSQ